MKMNAFFAIVIVALLFFAITAGVFGCFSGSASKLQGKPAPAFSAELLGGGTFNLADHLGKRPVVLDFWAVWCPPCRASLPKVAETADKFKDADVAICTVNLGDAPDKVASFLKSAGINPPVALDKDGTVAELYGVRSIPTLMLIDKAGMVQRVNVGAMGASELQEAIKKLL